MSKTSPVRWWRDDATRYQPRGAVEARAELPEEPPQWILDRLAPTQEQIEAYNALRRCMDDVMLGFATTMPTIVPPKIRSYGLASGRALGKP